MSGRRLKGELLRACSLLVLVLLCAATGAAETAARNIKGPITITSELLTADNKAHTALFEKSVIARTTTMTMYADKMLVQYSGETGHVVRIDVTGSVKVTTADRVITSGEAVYFADEEKIVFTGDPKAVAGGNVVTGKKMVYLMNEDRFLVEGSKVFLPSPKKR